MLEDGRSVIKVKPSSAMQARIDQIQEREAVRMRLAEDPGNDALKETLAVLDAAIDPLGARLRQLPVARPGRCSHERDFSQRDPYQIHEATLSHEPQPSAPPTLPAIEDIKLEVGPDYETMALKKLPVNTASGKEIIHAVETGRMAPRLAYDFAEQMEARARERKERIERNQCAANGAASARAAAPPRAPGHLARMKDLTEILSCDPVIHVNLQHRVPLLVPLETGRHVMHV